MSFRIMSVTSVAIYSFFCLKLCLFANLLSLVHIRQRKPTIISTRTSIKKCKISNRKCFLRRQASKIRWHDGKNLAHGLHCLRRKEIKTGTDEQDLLRPEHGSPQTLEHPWTESKKTYILTAIVYVYHSITRMKRFLLPKERKNYIKVNSWPVTMLQTETQPSAFAYLTFSILRHSQAWLRTKLYDSIYLILLR